MGALLVPLQVNQTAAANGSTADCSGAARALVEVRETAGGTATVTLEGGFDGGFNPAYAIGFQQVSGQAAPTRSVTPIAVTANGSGAYQLLDLYPFLRARVSSPAGGASITARVAFS
jgi:hypothetical protein